MLNFMAMFWRALDHTTLWKMIDSRQKTNIQYGTSKTSNATLSLTELLMPFTMQNILVNHLRSFIVYKHLSWYRMDGCAPHFWVDVPRCYSQSVWNPSKFLCTTFQSWYLYWDWFQLSPSLQILVNKTP